MGSPLQVDGVYVRGVEGTFTNSAFAELDSRMRASG